MEEASLQLVAWGKVDSPARQAPSVETMPLLQTTPPSELESTQTPPSPRSGPLRGSATPFCFRLAGSLRHGLFLPREEGRRLHRGWVSVGVGGRDLRGRLQSGGGVAASVTTSLT